MTGDFAPLARLALGSPRFLLFTGKGGVGKTTCAAAAAVALAEQGRRTLVFSTDPAHSLGDCLGQTLAGAARPVSGLSGLWAAELDAQAALAEFQDHYGPGLADFLAAATYLDAEEAQAFTKLGVPGVDELMGLRRIVDLLGSGEYQHLVWDSAPTGHTLRLLSLPELLDQWVRLLATMQRKYLYVVERLAGRGAAPPEADILLAVKRIIRRFQAAVRDGALCRAVAVTVPEAVAAAELLRLAGELRRRDRDPALGDQPDGPPGQACPHCAARRRRHEAQWRLQAALPGVEVVLLPEQGEEVQGLSRLRELLGPAPDRHRAAPP